MTIEEILKALILSQYPSVKDFAAAAGIGYSTVHAILDRGLDKANIKNIVQICRTLEISVDDLTEGRIVSTRGNVLHEPPLREVPAIIMYARQNIEGSEKYTLYGQPLTRTEAEMLLDALEIAISIIKRWRKERE